MLQLSSREFMCAFHQEISSVFGKSFLFLFLLLCFPSFVCLHLSKLQLSLSQVTVTCFFSYLFKKDKIIWFSIFYNKFHLYLPTGGLFEGGFTNTWTSADEDWPELSVTFKTKVYIPSSRLDSWRYGVLVFCKWGVQCDNQVLCLTKLNFLFCFCTNYSSNLLKGVKNR